MNTCLTQLQSRACTPLLSATYIDITLTSLFNTLRMRKWDQSLNDGKRGKKSPFIVTIIRSTQTRCVDTMHVMVRRLNDTWVQCGLLAELIELRGGTFFRNVGRYLQNYMVMSTTAQPCQHRCQAAVFTVQVRCGQLSVVSTVTSQDAYTQAGGNSFKGTKYII